jgi:cobalt-zinc-cadmium efflux system membrane fusion protein
MERGVLPGQAVTPSRSWRRSSASTAPGSSPASSSTCSPRCRSAPSAEVQLNAYPDHPFLGTVEHLAAKVDAEAQTVVARIPIENRETILRIGLFGSARIATTVPSRRARSRCSPSPRLRDRGRRQAGGVRARRGRVFELHEVVLGASGPGVVEILKGLREGELVVTHGAWSLKSVLLKGTFGEDHGH